MEIYESIGLIGVALILVAYFLLQIRKLDQKGVPYSILNLLGAIFILISLIFDWNLPAFVIEVCWLLISAYGIYRATRRTEPKPASGT